MNQLPSSSATKEANTIIMDQSPVASSMKEKQERLEKLNKMIDVLENITTVFRVLVFFFGSVCMCLLFLSIKLFGIPFYSILLASHSISFFGLYIVHYQILPPLIDKRSIFSHEIEEKRPFFSAYHPSKNEMFWCYQRISLYSLTITIIWKYMSYMELSDNMEDRDVGFRLICNFIGILLVLFSAYGVIPMGPLYSQTEIQKPKQGNDKSNKTVSSKTHDSLGEQKVENIEEINKLKKEMVEKDVFYTKLIKEKENEIIRLRKEEQECR
ncbi:hypothetical protein MOSE0_I09780 [Monosporozyma servazzii]